MLQKYTSLEQIDVRKLMDLYAEGNLDNAEYFYPDLERGQALVRAEQDFIEYLRTRFFTGPGRDYWVLEEDGTYLSALRLSTVEEGFYYLEALETHPEYRRRGHGAKLLGAVLEELKARGPFRVCDSVGKGNLASLRTHASCGFAVVSDRAYNYLSGETCEQEYGMEYRFPV